MAKRSVGRPKPRGPPRRRPRAPEPPPRLVPRHIDLRENPHAHAVCRQCGRITEVTLSAFDIAQITALAAGTSSDWSVDGISLSMTGLCPRCRQGLPAP